MLTIEKERSVQLPNNGVGYIVGEYVLAPFFYNYSFTALKDGQKLVLTFQAVSALGISYLKLPFPIVCEPLHFRHERIHSDTFFFKVSDDVQLCKGANLSCEKGKFEVGVPADFCPVFDRHTHLLGFNIGLLHKQWVTVKIEELL